MEERSEGEGERKGARARARERDDDDDDDVVVVVVVDDDDDDEDEDDDDYGACMWRGGRGNTELSWWAAYLSGGLEGAGARVVVAGWAGEGAGPGGASIGELALAEWEVWW